MWASLSLGHKPLCNHKQFQVFCGGMPPSLPVTFYTTVICVNKISRQGNIYSCPKVRWWYDFESGWILYTIIQGWCEAYRWCKNDLEIMYEIEIDHRNTTNLSKLNLYDDTHQILVDVYTTA